MGKPTIVTKKKQEGVERRLSAFFISMALKLKADKVHKLFQKRDHEGAVFEYEEVVKLLPRNHIDVASLRSNMAACYVLLGDLGVHHVIKAYNLALDVAPKYNKALMRRAKCYEGLNKMELVLRDVNLVVLGMELANAVGLETVKRLRKKVEKLGVMFDDKQLNLGVTGLKVASSVKKNKVLKKGCSKAERGVFDGAVLDRAP